MKEKKSCLKLLKMMNIKPNGTSLLLPRIYLHYLLSRIVDNITLYKTGASSGIGEGTAIHFSKFGAHVILTGRNEEALKKTAQQCLEGSKFTPVVLPGDLTKEEDVKRIVGEAVAATGRLDILVNSAGIVAKGTIETTSLEQFDDVFNINVRSIYHLTMLCVPHLVKTKGSIVNVSSVNGVRAFPGVLAYCMSKSAIDQMTKCIALELAPKQVRVNAVNPGVIITEVHKRGGMNDEEYKQFLERSKGTHALGRVGTVDEVAGLIAFLASDNASFITGDSVEVDGGRHAMCPR